MIEIPKEGCVKQAVTPPRPVTYKFMKELSLACDKFFEKRGLKWRL